MAELELRPKKDTCNGDRVYIKVYRDKVTITPVIDGCGNEFVVSASTIQKLITK